MKIDANAITVEELLDNTKNSYKVPRYQRNFSWEVKKQVTAFWEDLNDEELETLFMGTMVFNKTLEKNNAVEIIDGQQRLMTITIILGVIRDFFIQLGMDDLAFGLQRYITLSDRSGNSLGYKIIPHNNINKYYKKNIQEKSLEKNWETKNKAEEIVYKDYKYFKEEIEKKIKNKNFNNQISFLEQIRDKVLDSQIINVIVCSHDDAYGFFETLNDRGLPLSTADLLKNLLFRKILKDRNNKYSEEELENKWNLISENIGSDKIKSFIRTFWISKYGNIQEKKLYHAIKKEKQGASDCVVFLEELIENANYYKKILNPYKEEWDFNDMDNIRRSIENINYLRVTQPHSLMLSLMRKRHQLNFEKDFKIPEFWQVFTWIEKFSFIFTLSNQSPSMLEKIYTTYAKNIEQAKNKSQFRAELINLKEKLKELFISEQVFKEEFLELEYTSRQRNYFLFILNKINYKDDQEQDLKFNSVNIEHILPQTPDKCWKLQKRDIKDYVNTIGNLTILNQKLNKEAQNKCLDFKKEKYAQSKLKMTKELLKQLEKNDYHWDKELIYERTKKLADEAWDIFQIN